jgi:hypothetical protein
VARAVDLDAARRSFLTDGPGTVTRDVVRAEVDPAHRLAVRGHAPLAVAAAAALGDGRDQHPVADAESLHRLADLGDRADRFVPQDAAVGHRRDVTLQDVQVGTADRRGVDPDHDVGRFGDRGIGNVLPGLAARAVVHQCFHGLDANSAAPGLAVAESDHSGAPRAAAAAD